MPLSGPGRVAACSIAAKRHFALGRVVARSFLQHHPGIPFYLLLADEPGGLVDPAAEPCPVLTLEDLPALPAALRFAYGQQELTYAATPFLIDRLLAEGYDAVLFIKQESLVTGSLQPQFAALATADALLTPHLLTPLAGEPGAERELNILQCGSFNGGLVGFSNRPEARAFLAWWSARLVDGCLYDPVHGLHFEQRWLDFAPSFLDRVEIVRDPGVNTGHWNLPEREVRLDGEEITVDEHPCRLFRFSGYDPDVPEFPTRYFRRLSLDALGPAGEVFRRYRERLLDAGWESSRRWPYAFDAFADGRPIAPVLRTLYRETPGLAGRFPDPFSPLFADWLLGPADDRTPPLPRLWALLHPRRADLRQAFPDPAGADRAAYLAWTVTHGPREYGLAPELFAAPGMAA